MFVFSVLASAISIYSILCFIRIMLTWFPGAEYSKFGQFLSQMCDPYLNIFRRFRFLRFSSFDFTPAIALCILMAAQSFCAGLATGAGLRISSIIAMFIMLAGNIVSSILGFFSVILIIRLIAYIIVGDGQSSYTIWTAVDRAITPIIFRISGSIFKNQPVSFVKALIVSIIAILIFTVIFSYLIRYLGALISMIPV